MGIKVRYGRRSQASVLALVVFAMAAFMGACGDRVVEEETAPEDMELALEQDAEPELADVADGVEAETETPVAAPPRRQEPAPARQEPPPAAAPVESPSEFIPDEEPIEPERVAVTAGVGSEFEVVLLEELSTKTNNPGDRFRMRVTSPLIDENMVVIQMNSYVNGEVTAVQKSGARGEEAIIKVTFHDVELLGDTWPLSASVVEAQPETQGPLQHGRQGRADRRRRGGGCHSRPRHRRQLQGYGHRGRRRRRRRDGDSPWSRRTWTRFCRKGRCCGCDWMSRSP